MIVSKIIQLEKSGDLKLLVSAGVIPVKVKYYYDIYRHYEKELDKNRLCNNCIMQSISNTSVEFKANERTVYRAIKMMQQND